MKIRVPKITIHPFYSLRRAAVFAFGTFILVSFFWFLAGDVIDKHVSHRFLFWARSLMGGPGLDSRIKIFVLDDPTVSRMKALDLTLNDWAAVFAALDHRHPAAIMIDKIFDAPYPSSDVTAFVQQMSSLSNRSPVIPIAFVSPKAIPTRPLLATNRFPYRMEDFLRSGQKPPRWLQPHEGFFYGAPPEMVPAFSSIGHALYDGVGYITPLMRINDQTVIPHWSLLAGSRLGLDENGLWVDEKSVPIDHAGRILVNLDRMEVYSRRAYSMTALIERARHGKEISVVNEGDYVVILPAMFTGNADWRETPLGPMPGGYVITAMLQSVLSGAWLSNGEFATPWVLALCSLIGPAMAATLIPLAFWIFLVTTGLLVVLGTCGAFLLAGSALSWPLALSALLIGALITFADRTRLAQIEQARMEKEINTAKVIQDSLFPKMDRTAGKLDITWYYQAASECGGDWWGHFILPNGIEYVMIGDATGHGASAALVTAMAFSSCAMFIDDIKEGKLVDHSPGLLLERLNTVLSAAMNQMATMTFFAAAFDLQRGIVTFANAGHPLPYHFSPVKEGEGEVAIQRLNAKSTLLGLDPKITVPNRSLPIQNGDRIFFYTDGLIENKGRDQTIWTRNLSKKVRDYATMDGKAMRDRIVEEATGHFSGCPYADDVTIVVVEISGVEAVARAEVS